MTGKRKMACQNGAIKMVAHTCKKACEDAKKWYNHNQKWLCKNCCPTGSTGTSFKQCIDGVVKVQEKCQAVKKSCYCPTNKKNYAHGKSVRIMTEALTCINGKWKKMDITCDFGGRTYKQNVFEQWNNKRYRCYNGYWLPVQTSAPTKAPQDGRGMCTGRTDKFGGLTPNAPYKTPCLHRCVAYGSKGSQRSWCTGKQNSHTKGRHIGWGWCYKCDQLPGLVKCELKVRDPVSANWQGRGKFYNGQVSKLRRPESQSGKGDECRYDLRYADGDVEENVDVKHIKRRACSGTTHSVCDRVEVNWKGRGRFYAGRISAAEGKGCRASYSVKYDDGDAEHHISMDRIKKLGGLSETFKEGQHILGNYLGKGKYYTGQVDRVVTPCCYNIRYDDGDREACVDPQKLRRVKVRPCEDMAAKKCVKGYTVEANWRNYGRFYSARVSKCEHGIFDVVYNDGDKETGIRGTHLRSCRATSTCKKASLKNRVGDRVEANHKGNGQWYDARVTAVDSVHCVYCVKYEDDNRSECNIQMTKLRPGNMAACSKVLTGSYKRGARVSVNYKGSGTNYEGKVCGCSSVSPATFKICYEDGDNEHNVGAKNIKPRN